MARKRKNTVSDAVTDVFADLGIQLTQEDYIKIGLARAINNKIVDKGLTQQQAAKLMKIDQPKVSAILRGKLKDFSTDRLMSFITNLGSDLEIKIHRRQKGIGTVKIKECA